MQQPYQLNHLEINKNQLQKNNKKILFFPLKYLQRKSDRRPTLSRIKTNDIATAKYVIPHESIAYDAYSIRKFARTRIRSPKKKIY
jgi:hypothetical protein